MNGVEHRSTETALTGHSDEKLKTRVFDIIANIRRNKVSYIMIAPFLTCFILFTVIPVVSSIVLSFTYFNMLETPKFIGLENYIRLFLDDEVFLIAVKNTLIFALLTGPLGYILSFIFAWFINELRPLARTFMTILYYAPSISGNIFVIWLFLFSGDAYGYVNSRLLSWGIIKEPVQFLTDPDTNLYIVIIVMLWMSMGAGFLAFIAGLQNIDYTLYEAGAIDGIKNRWQELWYITIPQMAPQLMFGAVLSIASSFSTGRVAMELTGFPSTDYSTHTIITHILDYGNLRYEMGYASAIAVVLFVAMVCTNNLIRRFLSRFSDE